MAEQSWVHQHPRAPLSYLQTRIGGNSFTQKGVVDTYMGKNDNFEVKSESEQFWVLWMQFILWCNKTLSPRLIRVKADHTPQNALCKHKTRKRIIGSELNKYKNGGSFEIFW